MRDRKDDLQENAAYVALAKAFAEKREAKGIKQRDIDFLAKTGNGKVRLFEKLSSSPTLFTFVKWCTEAGIDINLKMGTRSVRQNAKRIRERIKYEKENPSSIIDQLKLEKNQNKK